MYFLFRLYIRFFYLPVLFPVYIEPPVGPVLCSSCSASSAGLRTQESGIARIEPRTVVVSELLTTRLQFINDFFYIDRLYANSQDEVNRLSFWGMIHQCKIVRYSFIWGLGGGGGSELEHVPVFCFWLTESDKISLAGIRGWAMENRVYAEDPFKAKRQIWPALFAQSTVLQKKVKWKFLLSKVL